jgi:predicted phage tail protein
MTKVVLYGNLKEKYGESFTVHISSAVEAITALGEQLPGFYKDIYEGSWCIKRGDTFLDIDTITIGMGEDDLHIIPEAVGAKSEWVPIILGVALMAIAPGGAALAKMGTLQSMAFGVGVSLALGGISQMLFAPTLGSDPSDNEDAKIRKNGIFGGQWNLAKEGQVIPLIYGRMRVGSQVVQNALRTEDFNIATEIEGTADDLVKTIITNDTLLTMESGEGVSSTYIGFQTSKVYTDYGLLRRRAPGQGSYIDDPLLELKATQFGSIDDNNTPWSKRVLGLYERVETKDGEDTLYLCAIFGHEFDTPQNVVNRNFLAKISFPGVSDDYQFATLGEDDFTSYLISDNARFGESLSWKIAQGYGRQTEVREYTAINGVTESSIDEGKYFYEEDRINVDNTWINTVTEEDPEIDYLQGPSNIDNERMIIAEWNLTNILPGNPTTHQLSLGTTYTVEWDYDV